jgi:hypothetical protein
VWRLLGAGIGTDDARLPLVVARLAFVGRMCHLVGQESDVDTMESARPKRGVVRAANKPRVRKSRAPGSKLVEAQVAGAFRVLEKAGVLTGHADKVSARIDHGLLTAAMRKLGSDNTSYVLQAALAAFVGRDPFVEWFLSDRDRLPADFELAI